MDQLNEIATRRRAGGFNAREMIRHEGDVAACYSCRKYHPLRGNNADQDYADFIFRHPTADGHVVLRLNPNQVRDTIARAQRRRRLRHDSILNFTHNASVLEAFQSSDQSLDLTSFNSLASSATAGWGSHYVDNSSNLYLDYLWAITIAAVNTAPGSNKAFYVFTGTSLNTTDRPATGASSGVLANSSSTSGTLTFPSISTTPTPLPLLHTIPYSTQNVANQTPLMATAVAFKGFIGLYLWFALVNFSGMTIAASSNAWKYRGVYNTVA